MIDTAKLRADAEKALATLRKQEVTRVVVDDLDVFATIFDLLDEVERLLAENKKMRNQKP